MEQINRRTRTREIESGVVRYVDHSLAIAKQINLILKKINKNQTYLAKKLGKKESQISKWLTGTHNFTLKTISKIEDVLGESIIICPKDAALKKHFWVHDNYQIVNLKDKPKNSSTKFKNINLLVESGVSELETDCVLN